MKTTETFRRVIVSLREAIAQANANGAGEDTIQFTPVAPQHDPEFGSDTDYFGDRHECCCKRNSCRSQ